MAASEKHVILITDGDDSGKDSLLDVFNTLPGKDISIKPFNPPLDKSGSMRDDIWRHELLHAFRKKDTFLGATEAINISKVFDDKIQRIDASKYRSPKTSDNILGAPEGYQGFKLEMTPELEELLAEIRASTGASRRSGERLAAACHDGIAAPTSAMKPLRFRGNNGTTFAITGRMW